MTGKAAHLPLRYDRGVKLLHRTQEWNIYGAESQQLHDGPFDSRAAAEAVMAALNKERPVIGGRAVRRDR